jgi:hypothetical protein
MRVAPGTRRHARAMKIRNRAETVGLTKPISSPPADRDRSRQMASYHRWLFPLVAERGQLLSFIFPVLKIVLAFRSGAVIRQLVESRRLLIV